MVPKIVVIYTILLHENPSVCKNIKSKTTYESIVNCKILNRSLFQNPDVILSEQKVLLLPKIKFPKNISNK
jgi:hypothetical protein